MDGVVIKHDYELINVVSADLSDTRLFEIMKYVFLSFIRFEKAIL